MNPENWNVGNNLCVTEACPRALDPMVIAPNGCAAAMVADLKEKVFPTREIRMLLTGADGARAVSRM